MDKKWSEFYRRKAEEAAACSVFFAADRNAVRVIQDILESTELCSHEKLEHVQYFLNQYKRILSQ